MMNVKSLVLVAVALACGMGWSMPSKADLKTAERKAAELMRSDLEALKAGSQTKLGMGETAYVLAEQAKDEATRCVLLSGALHYFVAAGEAARADAAFQALRTGVADLPPSFVADLLARELSGRKGSGCLFEALEHARRQVAYMKEAEQLVAELRKFPGNSVARRRLAECRALAGDWPAALAAFAELKGERARDVAVCERHPATAEKKLPAAEIAAFWWSYPTDNPDGRLTGFKVHAADWYRKALAGQAADGLDGLLMQKRVAFVDSPAPTQFAVAKKPQPKKPERAVAEDEKPAGPIPAAPATIAALPRKFTLKNRSVLELLPVPVGSMKLQRKKLRFKKDAYWGREDGVQTVTFTRPFWMGRTLVSQNQWLSEMKMPEACVKRRRHPAFKVLGGLDQPVSGDEGMDVETSRLFCEKLTQRFRKQLPAGYVFRLPTIAECWYVRSRSFPDLQESVPGSADPYRRFFWDVGKQTANLLGAHVDQEGGGFFKNKLPSADKMVADAMGFCGLHCAVGVQYVLDTFNPHAQNEPYRFFFVDKKTWTPGPTLTELPDDPRLSGVSFADYRHPDEESDPCAVYTGKDVLYGNVAGEIGDYIPAGAATSVSCSRADSHLRSWRLTCFRIVLGPDLLTERKGK